MIRIKSIGIPAGIVALATLRVLMAPLPNIEPIMLFVTPFSIVFGPLIGFIFAAGSMLTSEMFMGILGLWSIYTSITYGVIGLLCGLAGKIKRKWNRRELTLLSFFMVLFYDTVTSIFFALQFMIPIPVALIQMIPFTLLHMSSCVLVFLFAPSLMKMAYAMQEFSPSKWIAKFY